MGRHCSLNKRKLASFDPETRISKCLLCHKTMKGNLLGNIKRHYVRIHNYTFENGSSNEQSGTTGGTNMKLIKRNKFIPRSSTLTTINSQSNSNTYVNTTTCSNLTSSTTFKLNKNEFLKCCIGLVSNNITFRLFDDINFKRIIQPYENAFNLSLNSIKVEELSFNYANTIREHISILLDKKLINLKVEMATKHDKSIAVLNIQYMKDFRIHTHTISIIELKKRNAGESLRTEIIKCLGEYNVGVEQVHTITMDNVAYCLKATEQLRTELAESPDFYEDDYDAENESNADADDEGIIENENFVKIYVKLKEVLPYGNFLPHAIKQAAQELFYTNKPQIENCRLVVKRLRAQIQESNSLRKPSLECPSKWFSTYFMIESLHFLKDFINSNELEMPIDWLFIEQFLQALKPLIDCAKELHNDQYIIGDFFRDWLLCETKLENILENVYAKQLNEFMQKRKIELMENDWFLAALYFDPRFNFMGSPFFDDEKRRTAALYILDLNVRLTTLNGNALVSENENNEFSITKFETPSSSSTTPAPNTLAQDDPYGALELKLSLSASIPTENTGKISQKVENLAYGQRMPFSTNILDYWKVLAFKEYDLAQLAHIILAVPANQYSVERAVTALVSMLANQRTNLNSETFKNLSFIKLNTDILDLV